MRSIRPCSHAQGLDVSIGGQQCDQVVCCAQDVFQDDEAIQVCIYCHQPCDADVSGFHPAWTCAWCRVHAHVSCYHAYHSDDSSSAQHGRSHDGFQGKGDTAARYAADCVRYWGSLIWHLSE